MINNIYCAIILVKKINAIQPFVERLQLNNQIMAWYNHFRLFKGQLSMLAENMIMREKQFEKSGNPGQGLYWA
jgi:hypothetical protein